MSENRKQCYGIPTTFMTSLFDLVSRTPYGDGLQRVRDLKLELALLMNVHVTNCKRSNIAFIRPYVIPFIRFVCLIQRLIFIVFITAKRLIGNKNDMNRICSYFYKIPNLYSYLLISRFGCNYNGKLLHCYSNEPRTKQSLWQFEKETSKPVYTNICS